MTANYLVCNIEEYEAKGYKLRDANMFGQGDETCEILIFVK